MEGRKERFNSPAEEECVTIQGTQNLGDGRVVIFYSDNTYRFAPVVRPR